MAAGRVRTAYHGPMAHSTALELHDAYVAALALVGPLGPEGECEEVGPFLCVNGGFGVSRANVAVVTGKVVRPREALRDVMDWFAARGLNLRLDLRASADTGVLAAATLDRFQFWSRQRSYLLERREAPGARSSGIAVRRVETAEDQFAYCVAGASEAGDTDAELAVTRAATAVPGVSLYVGFAGGVPVAHSMAIVRGNMATVHNLFVAPEARGRGAGTVLTEAAIAGAKDAGASAVSLHSSHYGPSLFEALGFVAIEEYAVVGLSGPPGS